MAYVKEATLGPGTRRQKIIILTGLVVVLSVAGVAVRLLCSHRNTVADVTLRLSLPALLKKAAAGDAHAQYQMGQAYDAGLGGVEKTRFRQ